MGDTSDTSNTERIANMQDSINELVKANSLLTQLLMSATAAKPPVSECEKVADSPPAPLAIACSTDCMFVPATSNCNKRRVTSPPPPPPQCCCHCGNCCDNESDDSEGSPPSPFYTCASSLLELLLQIIFAVILIAWLLGGTLFTAIV
jgi:hypothetical protein